MNSSFEVRNKLRSGKEISDREICWFVVNLVMPLFAFAFNGEFKLKVIRVYDQSNSTCLLSDDIYRTGQKDSRILLRLLLYVLISNIACFAAVTHHLDTKATFAHLDQRSDTITVKEQ